MCSILDTVSSLVIMFKIEVKVKIKESKITLTIDYICIRVLKYLILGLLFTKANKIVLII